jgi:DNA repair exonuclease SbcCD ATPase subunit
MPRLTRLRFVNVGHVNARMENLILECCDKNGNAIDTTLWLRNGGGKSSILNLFYSLINPNRQQFLGSKADQGKRALGDYILEDDAAVVIAEWQLDTNDDEKKSYLTGCFYEWRQGELERLFFAARVKPPQLTLNELPISDSQGRRFNLYAFKQVWQNLGKDYPELDAREFGNQTEWREVIDKEAGLDPELFSYQLRMNAREGGADELFRFKDTEQFVDFFLELVLPAERGKAIAQNLDKHAASLRERQEILLPSLTLIESLVKKITPMLEIAAQRQQYRAHVGELYLRLNQLNTHLMRRASEVENQLNELLKVREQLSEKIEQLRKDETHYEVRMLSFHRRRLEKRLQYLEKEKANLEKQLNEATRNRLIWKAAIPLLQVERDEAKVRHLETLLEAQNTEFAPNWAEVKKTATTLSAALAFRAAETKREAETKQAEVKVLFDKGAKARQSAGILRQEIGRQDKEREHLSEKLEKALDSRKQLEKFGTVKLAESLHDALERWQQTIGTIEFEVNALAGRVSTQKQYLNKLRIDLDAASSERLKTEHSVKQLQEELGKAREERDKLMGHLIINRVLEEVNDTSLNLTSLKTLQYERSQAETRLLSLIGQLSDHQSILDYFQENKLFPPTRNVQVILRALEHQKVTADPGWMHLASGSVKPEEAHGFIARHPELMQGVLVRDNHFERAKAVLENTTEELDAPVVIAKRSIAFEESEEERGLLESRNQGRFVVGPSSDAHFDSNAAHLAAQDLEIRVQREQVRHEETEREIRELRDAIDLLEHFINRYPGAWFTNQEENLQKAEKLLESCITRVAILKEEQLATQQLIAELDKEREILFNQLEEAKEQLRTLRTHLDIHGSEAQLIKIEKRIAIIENENQQLELQIQQNEELAMQNEIRARAAESEVKRLENNAHNDENTSRSLDYLESEPPMPKSGDVETLREAYKSLCKILEDKTDGNQLQRALISAREARQESHKKFRLELEGSIKETEVKTALAQLSDKNKVDLVHEQALKNIMSINNSLGSSKANVGNARAELNKHRQEYDQLKINLTPIELELNNEELESLEFQAKLELEQAHIRVTEREEELKILDSKQQSIIDDRNKLEILQKDLTTYSVFYEGLFQGLSIDPTNYQIDFTLYSLETQIDDMEKRLAAAKRLDEELLKQRNSIYSEFTRALRGVTIGFAKQLQEWTEEMLELDVQKLLEDLETRAKNIREALEESEEHRKVIITETVMVADSGIQLLQSLANSSKLPEKANMLTDHKFLKITLDKTTHPAEKDGRIGELIDDIIHDKQSLTGMQLIQRAVRKLAQRIKVEVLFPDMDAEPRYLPITDMSKESGGERLTSAVLLYCSLAQQRAKARGKSFLKTSSTLLLDNPVGTASRAKFLELQRETAKAMNIQLIYATGVNDFEAIRTMPNVVRLRNEKRNSKHHRLLEVAHVIRPDENSELGAN